MVQVDVFWSYGIGAGFAYAAQKQLRDKPPTKENGGFMANKYFTMNLLYLATMFGPSGLYLVWGFTNWETMQAGDKGMPAWLVTLFAITNVTQGLLGFWVTYKLQSAGKRYAAFLQLLVGYFGMFFILVHGWDGKGYQRFFSQDRADFLRWTTDHAPDHILRWLGSPVAITLGAMGLVLIPVMVGWMTQWMMEAQRSALSEAPQASRVREYSPLSLAVIMLTLIFGVVLGTAIIASLLIHQLGWALGVLAFAAIGGVGIAGPRGLLHALWSRMDPGNLVARAAASQSTANLAPSTRGSS